MPLVTLLESEVDKWFSAKKGVKWGSTSLQDRTIPSIDMIAIVTVPLADRFINRSHDAYI